MSDDNKTEEPVLAIVTGCENCPLAHVDGDYWERCEHPSAPAEQSTKISEWSGSYGRAAKLPGAPGWCPLLAAPLLLRRGTGM